MYSGGQINRNDLLINISLLPVSKIEKENEALQKTKNLLLRASKLIKPFGHETDFNGEGSNRTWEIYFILDLFCVKQ